MLELTAAIFKAFAYVAALTASGIILARFTLTYRLARYPTPSVGLSRWAGSAVALAAACTALLFYLRLGGEEDAAALNAIIWSPLGASLGLQFVGGLWIALLARRPVAAIGALLILAAFGVSGHAASQGITGSATIVLHVSAAAWWWGGLLILLSTSRTHTDGFPGLVAGFSRQAVWIVGALLASALSTAALLLEFRPDLSRTYDQGLLLKLSMSMVLLGLAGANKFIFTPRLASDPRARTRLRAMILVELLVFAGIFAVTAWLTTYQSPHDAIHAGAEEVPAVDGRIAIYQPWAPAMLTPNGTGAGYMVIVNKQSVDDYLMGAKSPWAEHVTLHRSITEDNIARMRPIARLRIAAGGRVAIKPGVYHLMFTGLYSRFVAGDAVPLALVFERAGEVNFMLQVRSLNGAPYHGH
jgi:copper(I)-binding protein/putative copper export protein